MNPYAPFRFELARYGFGDKFVTILTQETKKDGGYTGNDGSCRARRSARFDANVPRRSEIDPFVT